jgi:nitrate reductase NapE component
MAKTAEKSDSPEKPAEPEVKSTSSAPSTTQKSGNTKKIIIIVVVVLVLCLIVCVAIVAGSGLLVRNAANSITSDSVLNTIQDQINRDSKDGSTINLTQKTWPSDIPSYVPQFKYGDISLTTKDNSSGKPAWTIGYLNVKDNAIASYTQDLKDAGWTVDESSKDIGLLEATYGTYALSIGVFGPGATLTVSAK